MTDNVLHFPRQPQEYNKGLDEALENLDTTMLILLYRLKELAEDEDTVDDLAMDLELIGTSYGNLILGFLRNPDDYKAFEALCGLCESHGIPLGIEDDDID